MSSSLAWSASICALRKWVKNLDPRPVKLSIYTNRIATANLCKLTISLVSRASHFQPYTNSPVGFLRLIPRSNIIGPNTRTSLKPSKFLKLQAPPSTCSDIYILPFWSSIPRTALKMVEAIERPSWPLPSRHNSWIIKVFVVVYRRTLPRKVLQDYRLCSARDIMIRPWTAICGGLVTFFILVAWYTSPTYTPHEPRPIPHPIPLLGHLIPFSKYRRSLFTRYSYVAWALSVGFCASLTLMA